MIDVLILTRNEDGAVDAVEHRGLPRRAARPPSGLGNHPNLEGTMREWTRVARRISRRLATRPIAIPITSPIAVACDGDRRSA